MTYTCTTGSTIIRGVPLCRQLYFHPHKCPRLPFGPQIAQLTLVHIRRATTFLGLIGCFHLRYSCLFVFRAAGPAPPTVVRISFAHRVFRTTVAVCVLFTVSAISTEWQKTRPREYICGEGGEPEEWKGNCGRLKYEGDGRQGGKSPGRIGSRA